MRASVLGVGTELTEGQIVNKNASWISARLKSRGLPTSLHLVVPDHRRLIIEGLNFCAERSEVIFVTGGLGPTSDDFTRELITEWTGQPLEFHESSWRHLSERLLSRGYKVKEIQRQQCYFPRGAEILVNPEGTANGFTLQAHGKKLFVLPGPPREIEAIWNLSIAPWLEAQSENLDRHITRLWDTIGLGESDIAGLVEEALKGVEVEKGYRVHLPYVEVKMSYRQSEESKFLPWVDKLTETLAPHTLTRDGEDLAQAFAQSLASVKSVSLVDAVSGQFLLNRILPFLRATMSGEQSWSFSNDPQTAAPADLELQLLPKDEHTCEVWMNARGKKSRDLIAAPYKTINMRERRKQYFAESALIFWRRGLSTRS